jgi:excisionase family DNA binding protein
MARVGFEVPEERGTAAVFARVPAEAAEKLDRAAFALRRPKQEIVAALLATLDDDPVIGRAALMPRAVEQPEVLTLEETAELLRVDVDTVRGLVEAGGLPARDLAGAWRFSRRAVLDWLSDG